MLSLNVWDTVPLAQKVKDQGNLTSVRGSPYWELRLLLDWSNSRPRRHLVASRSNPIGLLIKHSIALNPSSTQCQWISFNFPAEIRVQIYEELFLFSEAPIQLTQHDNNSYNISTIIHTTADKRAKPRKSISRITFKKIRKTQFSQKKNEAQGRTGRNSKKTDEKFGEKERKKH